MFGVFPMFTLSSLFFVKAAFVQRKSFSPLWASRRVCHTEILLMKGPSPRHRPQAGVEGLPWVEKTGTPWLDVLNGSLKIWRVYVLFYNVLYWLCLVINYLIYRYITKS